MFEKLISAQNGVFARENWVFGRKLFHQNSVCLFHPALQGVQLHPVPPAHRLPVGTLTHRAGPRRPHKKEIRWQAVYYHFRKWSRDGSWEKVWQHSLDVVREDLDLTQRNLDGNHTPAKKGGESVAYQGRKEAKTSIILPITDGKGFILASTGILAGNHQSQTALPSRVTAKHPNAVENACSMRRSTDVALPASAVLLG
ncbi:MAG: hypothetical protein NZM11_03210 [Anaerolineales bacterium]|nr:hypothetical protein [Anaerolineales bacterium]